ncbi:hypothetical protein BHE74_00008340 [Ensete ventricosum]|nr:hypothetical protein BHE74_00008340 [Ensete ventricosum]RZR87463.1 hypothetical protein BHM03_00014879 [Ensete ventricosum]
MQDEGCKCPLGFEGDGVNKCEGIISKILYLGKKPSTEVGWSFLWVIFFGLVIAGVGAYAVYKYRIRVRFFKILLRCVS